MSAGENVYRHVIERKKPPRGAHGTHDDKIKTKDKPMRIIWATQPLLVVSVDHPVSYNFSLCPLYS